MNAWDGSGVHAASERKPDLQLAPTERDLGHVAGLDAVRALAALWVFTFHLASSGVDFGPLQSVARHGDTGLTIFFVLSGFLLYEPFARGPVDRRGYLVRRLLRLMPAYVLALIGLTLISGDHSFSDSPLTYLFFLQNFDPQLFQQFIGPAWTLQLEMTFCLLLPVIALVLARTTRPDVGRPAFVLMVLAIVSLFGGFAIATGIPGRPGLMLVSAFPFMVWAFVPGMILALVATRRPDAFRQLGRRPMLLAGIGLVLVGSALDIGYGNILTAGGATLVVAGVVVQRGSGRMLRVVAFAGATLSYPFYLWHVDLIRWFSGHGLSGWTLAMMAFLATIAFSALSYLAVERPAMRLARRMSRRPARATRRQPSDFGNVTPREPVTVGL